MPAPREATRPSRCATRVSHWTLAALLATSIVLEPRGARADVHAGAYGGALLATSRLALPGDDVRVDPGTTYAFAAGWTLWRGLAVEGRWQQAFTTLDLGGAASGGSTLDVHALTVGARYVPCDAERRIRPYLSGQVGWYHATGRATDGGSATAGRTTQRTITRSGDTIGFNAAAGLSLRLTHAISVEVEARYHYTSHLSFLTPLLGLTISFAP